MHQEQDDPDGEHEPEGDGHEPVERSPRDDLKVRSWLPRETADEDSRDDESASNTDERVQEDERG